MSNTVKFMGIRYDISSTQKAKDVVTTLIKENGMMARTDMETAELFASYFKDVYIHEDIAMKRINLNTAAWTRMMQ